LEVVEVNSIRVSVRVGLGLAVTMCAAVVLAGAPVPKPSGLGIYINGVDAGEFWMAYDSSSASAPLPSDFNVKYGDGSLMAFVGDWDGDGNHGVGLYDPNSSVFWLQDDTTSSPQDADFSISPFWITGLGAPGNMIPIAGDWDNDDVDEVGLYDKTTGEFHLRDSLDTGPADTSFVYGEVGTVQYPVWPVVGDWNNDGQDGIGIYLGGTDGSITWGNFWLRNFPNAGLHSIRIGFGDGSLLPVVGEWVAGTVGVGLYDPATGGFFVLNTLNVSAPPQQADASISYGGGGNFTPVVGNWEVIAP